MGYPQKVSSCGLHWYRSPVEAWELCSRGEIQMLDRRLKSKSSFNVYWETGRGPASHCVNETMMYIRKQRTERGAFALEAVGKPIGTKEPGLTWASSRYSYLPWNAPLRRPGGIWTAQLLLIREAGRTCAIWSDRVRTQFAIVFTPLLKA